jgi:DNA-binding transcriptional ArsR family regulator
MSIDLNAKFCVGLRHEIFHALQVVADPDARIHPDWKRTIGERLDARFRKSFDSIGGSHALWVVLPDVFEPTFVGRSFEELLAAVEAVPAETLRRRVLLGLLHDEALTSAILARSHDVVRALQRTTPTKREWLAFMGLYPPRPGAPLVRALELVRDDPETFRRHVVAVLRGFWRAGFDRTWDHGLGALEDVRARSERLFAACDLGEFLERSLVNVKVQDRGKTLTAVRGGYVLPIARIETAYFLPSMFNDRRHWSAYDREDRVVVHFPTFDPALSPADLPFDPSTRVPAIDPALVFRALGDATRFAIAELIAQKPQSAADLGRALGISRPTMSHHVAELRAAGLLDEQPLGAAVVLALRRDVVGRLGELTMAALFGSDAGRKRTRRSRRRR